MSENKPVGFGGIKNLLSIETTSSVGNEKTNENTPESTLVESNPSHSPSVKNTASDQKSEQNGLNDANLATKDSTSNESINKSKELQQSDSNSGYMWPLFVVAIILAIVGIEMMQDEDKPQGTTYKQANSVTVTPKVNSTATAPQANRVDSSKTVEKNTPSLILSAQNYLRALDYDPGPIDGVIGRKTTTAISNFMVDENLSWKSSDVTPSLVQALYNRLKWIKEPRTGTNLVLSSGEIVWCERESIRIENLRDRGSNSNQDIDAFNRKVRYYNDRCSSYKYYDTEMNKAKSYLQKRRDDYNNWVSE